MNRATVTTAGQLAGLILIAWGIGVIGWWIGGAVLAFGLGLVAGGFVLAFVMAMLEGDD